MRKRGFAIGRMYYAHPTSGERYYLRMLLNYVKGATSYEHLQIVDGTEHNTFKDACIVMGLFAYNNEWHQALEEDFPMLPKSNYVPSIHGGNRLVQEELAYD
jgi:hypothetical protein